MTGCDAHRVLCHLSASNDSTHVIGIGLVHVHQMAIGIITAAARPPSDQVCEGLISNSCSILKPGWHIVRCQQLAQNPTLDLILDLLHNTCKAATSNARKADRGRRLSQHILSCIPDTNLKIRSCLTPAPINHTAQHRQIRDVVSPTCNWYLVCNSYLACSTAPGNDRFMLCDIRPPSRSRWCYNPHQFYIEIN